MICKFFLIDRQHIKTFFNLKHGFQRILEYAKFAPLGYQTLLKFYISEGLHHDEARYLDGVSSHLIKAPKRHGVLDSVFGAATRDSIVSLRFTSNNPTKPAPAVFSLFV
jgi:hypothetical protein